MKALRKRRELSRRANAKAIQTIRSPSRFYSRTIKFKYVRIKSSRLVITDVVMLDIFYFFDHAIIYRDVPAATEIRLMLRRP